MKKTLQSVFGGFALLITSDLKQQYSLKNTADQQYGSDTTSQIVVLIFRENKHTDTDLQSSSSFGTCPTSDVQTKQKASEGGSASIFR